MYCVKCGVKLADHVEACPLCQTPVWNPDCKKGADRSFPDVYPHRPTAYDRRRLLAIFFSALCLLGAIVPLMVCLRLYHSVEWADYPMFSVATFYVIAVLPMWFRRSHPLCFLSLDFCTVAAYLYFLCRKTGGNWFLTYGLPITMVLGLFVVSFVALMGRSKKRKLCLLGTGFCMIGVFCLLTDLFGHLTFGIRLFIWGPYPFGCCLLVGGFFFVAAAIKPLRDLLERTFFY